MDWIRVRFRIEADDLEAATVIAAELLPGGFQVEDYRDLEETVTHGFGADLIGKSLTRKDRTHASILFYAEGTQSPAETAGPFRERLREAGIRHSLSFGTVREQDWRNAWRRHFKPTRVGRSLVVVPDWLEWKAAPGDVPIRMDPGLAFGSGTHETTRLCLEAIERELAKGDSVLDLGCGSGILAVAALLLGAGSAVALDIDPAAVKATRENLARNGIPAERCEVLEADARAIGAGRFDLVFANIAADAIVALAPVIFQALRPGGRAILSGILDAREAECAEALRNAGLRIAHTARAGCWTAYTAERGDG
jgi:ribosomal protein L11 methyltransferase